MPNPNFSEFAKDKARAGGKSPPKEKSPGGKGSMNVKTAGWGGLPGKSGPNRSAGVSRAKTYAKSSGL